MPRAQRAANKAYTAFKKARAVVTALEQIAKNPQSTQSLRAACRDHLTDARRIEEQRRVEADAALRLADLEDSDLPPGTAGRMG